MSWFYLFSLVIMNNSSNTTSIMPLSRMIAFAIFKSFSRWHPRGSSKGLPKRSQIVIKRNVIMIINLWTLLNKVLKVPNVFPSYSV